MAVERQVKKRKVVDEVNTTAKVEVETDAPATEQSSGAQLNLLVKRHSEKAKVPTKGSALSAGYDLYRSVVSLVL